MTAIAAKTDETTLPTWDLTDFYAGLDAPEIKTDLARAETDAKGFASRYAGKIAGLEGDVLAKAIQEYEALNDLLGKVSSYAQLVYALDMTGEKEGAFYQNTIERITDISAHTLFFTLEINKVEDAALEALYKAAPKLAHYRPWLRDVRQFRPYQLSQKEEALLHEKSVTGSAAWSRLFDETLAGLSFSIGGKELNAEEALHLLSGKDATARKEAAAEISRVLNANARTFAFITNTLAKDKAIEDKWRKLPRPISSRNIANCVEDEVVDALLVAVRTSYPALAHRYYKMKAQWLHGKDSMPWWDRNAPLPEDNDREYDWSTSVQVVLDAYEAFSPEMRTLGQKFFDNAWIDVAPRAGKSSGAFAHPTVPSVHPYLLLNHMNKLRDVMTLAHELGHGVHQLLAADQGALMADTPLTLAETASVFGEQLTFRSLLNQTKDASARKAMLASKVEDMLNTVVRQIAFCEFERKVHDARKDGELSVAQLNGFWLEVQKESLGDAFAFDDSYGIYWSYISHFIHSPFYVYAYAFGDCLVNALYGVYQEGAVPDFEDKYFAMLRAGGTLHHKELLAPFGLDASDPAFWQKGLDVIAGFIDELEDMQ